MRDIAEDMEDRVIVGAIIELAHRLGLSAIAEGVETPEQLEDLRAQGCDCMQGYMFGKPAPASEISRLLPWAGSGSPASPVMVEAGNLDLHGEVI